MQILINVTLMVVNFVKMIRNLTPVASMILLVNCSSYPQMQPYFGEITNNFDHAICIRDLDTGSDQGFPLIPSSQLKLILKEKNLDRIIYNFTEEARQTYLFIWPGDKIRVGYNEYREVVDYMQVTDRAIRINISYINCTTLAQHKLSLPPSWEFNDLNIDGRYDLEFMKQAYPFWRDNGGVITVILRPIDYED